METAVETGKEGGVLKKHNGFLCDITLEEVRRDS